MRLSPTLQQVLIGASAIIIASSTMVSGRDESRPVVDAAVSMIGANTTHLRRAVSPTSPENEITSATRSAIAALESAVRPLSHPDALKDAFRSYFAFKAANPDKVKKPYLYFVDYGLPSTAKRGYVFDMESLKIVDGPFTVAHGRGSSASQYGVPTRFSNASGSNSTSLGLYVTKALYDFRGHSGGRVYTSTGLRLEGVSTGFNDNALDRGVVAHGAPYVTPTKAGRSEGCPAMEPERAKELLPKLAQGAMVFLFAPNESWMEHDPWVSADAG
jgi:L,D-transpeptidase-like protein